MIFSLEDFNSIIAIYGIHSEAIKFKELQSILSDKNIRLIYIIQTKDKQRFVCRITHESHYPIWLIQKQSLFAMCLYNNGISTAQKLHCNGNYCIQWRKNGIVFSITLERYAGNDLKTVNIDTFRVLGELLGHTHAISQMYKQSIGFSFTMNAINTGRAKYKNIFINAKDIYLCEVEISKAAYLHDSLIHILRTIWPALPQGAVHGDLGLFNNILMSKNRFVIIDFNLSGDEAYLFDLMTTFYSSFYKFCSKKEFYSVNVLSLLHIFLKGYIKYRKLTTFEKQNFKLISALVNGIFYTKYLIKQYHDELYYDNIDKIEYIENIFYSGIKSYRKISQRRLP